MAKQSAQQSAQQVQDFLAKLASDPDLLLKFIKDPDGVMEESKVRSAEAKDRIRTILAVEVARQILVFPAAFIHWG